MNPPFYSTPVQTIVDGFKTVLGEKSWKYLVFNHTGFTRSMKDTMFAAL